MNKREIGKADEIKTLRLIAGWGYLTKSLVAKGLWPLAENVETKKKQALRLLKRLEKKGMVLGRVLGMSSGGREYEEERLSGRELGWILTKSGAEYLNEFWPEGENGNTRWARDGYDLSTLNFKKHIKFAERGLDGLKKNNVIWGPVDIKNKMIKEVHPCTFVEWNSDYTNCIVMKLVARKAHVADKVKVISGTRIQVRTELVHIW